MRKAEKKKEKPEKQEEIKVNTIADDPVNTDDWTCSVTFAMEGSSCDADWIEMFAEEASSGNRMQVKSINYKQDVLKILSQIIAREIYNKYSYLLNFQSTFEEAAKYFKEGQDIPAPLMALVIKAIILMYKKEDIDGLNKLPCVDPIELMASKPKEPLIYETDDKTLNNVSASASKRRDTDLSNKKKLNKKKMSDVDNVIDTTTIRVIPLSVGKEDTTLLRRGETYKSPIKIDDGPDNSLFKLYIAITGFKDPDLPLEMIKVGVPISSVLCVGIERKTCGKSFDDDLDRFWTNFRKSIWNTELIPYYRNVVFQIFTPQEESPKSKTEQSTYIYREISFLMYDLSDLKHLHKKYLEEMSLSIVDDSGEPFIPDTDIEGELDDLSYECINIPVIMQNILDILCGEDLESDEVRDQYNKERIPSISTGQYHTSLQLMVKSARSSRSSLKALISSVKFPFLRISEAIVMEVQNLHDKVKYLDRVYGIEDVEMQHSNSALHPKCFINRKRLPSANLDAEIKDYEKGLLGKIWRNYPELSENDEEDTNSNVILSQLIFPEIMLNYALYLLWIERKEREITEEEVSLENVSLTSSALSQTKFTVTDGSRIGLHKTVRPNHFSLPELKIINPETLLTLSEPLLRTGKTSLMEKTFISDSYLPKKYLDGIPLDVYDNLKEFMGDEAFALMKDYDFVEELCKDSMVARIKQAEELYNSVSHAYFFLTDSIYVVFCDKPTQNGVYREAYNVMLPTPVGLRDFHDYVIDNEKEWISEQRMTNGSKYFVCPNTLYNPSENFRNFTDLDFLMEDSIKYADRYTNKVEEMDWSETESAGTFVLQKSSQAAVELNEDLPKRFQGFQFDSDAVQISGIDTTYNGPDQCKVRVSLQERLYGTQTLGVHIQQGGHQLHLYSFACPEPHLETPYTFHIEYKNGIIVAFSKRKDDMGYDMKLSYPNGLTVEFVKNENSEYVKQMYITKPVGSFETAHIEKSRLFLGNGNIVKIMADETMEVLLPDTSSVIMHPDEAFQGENITGATYIETRPNGLQRKVVKNVLTDEKFCHIFKNRDVRNEAFYYRRTDDTSYVQFGDGTLSVQFSDGSKICTYLTQEETQFEDSVSCYGEDMGEMYSSEDTFILINKKMIMEHPDYATVIHETRNQEWRINLPQKSSIVKDRYGCYRVHIDNQTDLEVGISAIRMTRYDLSNSMVMSAQVDLTVFNIAGSAPYCTVVDSTNRVFTVEADGNCYSTEIEVESQDSKTFSLDVPKRYFVVRRDLSGFEIVRNDVVQAEIAAMTDDTVPYTHAGNKKFRGRLFAFVKPKDTRPTWNVETITPSTIYRDNTATDQKLPSTYGGPKPSWMHPFPKKRKKIPLPDELEGRVILEINPTCIPNPTMKNKQFSFVDTTDFPEKTWTDSVTMARDIAEQNQQILMDIYCAGIEQYVNAAKICEPNADRLNEYLKKSEASAKLCEYLKNCIRYKLVVDYFHSPKGIAWLIIQSIIDVMEIDDVKVQTRYSDGKTETADTSEVEYNLEIESEVDFSDLSYRSGLSAKTAAAAFNRVPICSWYLPKPRGVKSEPIYKIDFRKNDQESSSSGVGDYLSKSSSSVTCSFDEDDVTALAVTSPETQKEPEVSVYSLDDLIRLALV